MAANCKITVKTKRGSAVADMNPDQLKAIAVALKAGSDHVENGHAKDVIWFADKIERLLEVG